MPAVVLLVFLTLVGHRLALQPLTALLTPGLNGSWLLWSLLLLGLWLFAGSGRRS